MTARKVTKTRYITVRLTEKEAQALLKMARSGDYNHDEGDYPEITIPSNRAERKIQAALNALRNAGNKGVPVAKKD